MSGVEEGRRAKGVDPSVRDGVPRDVMALYLRSQR